MPIALPASRAMVLIRRDAFERAGLVRAEIDARFNLTDEEFRVEGGLIALGPLPSIDMVGDVVESGLAYFDDFFEMSGNWPEWLSLMAMGGKEERT
jgi:hypothetical protein